MPLQIGKRPAVGRSWWVSADMLDAELRENTIIIVVARADLRS
jgi:hypothetical protein